MSKLSFETVLNHLLDSKHDIPQSHLKYYSDLNAKDLQLFMDTWRSVKPQRKHLLLDRLVLHYDENTIVSYDEIARALLTDADGEVRARAIHLLADTQDARLIHTLINIFRNDPDLAPRLEATHILGEFILFGELEDLKKEDQRQVEDALLAVVKGEDHPALRKRALEALGFSPREEVNEQIEYALEHADPTWVASALTAIGHSQDEERWGGEVVSKLLDEDPRIRNAAVKAAGELNLSEAAPILIQILEDEEEDDEVLSSVIWSLSQIGGEDARAYLVSLMERTDDEDTLEYLEEALENLDFNESIDHFDMLDIEGEFGDLDDEEIEDEDEK